MALYITRSDLHSLRQHARAAWPDECCGVLVGRRSHGDTCTERVVPAQNIAEHDRSRNYQIDWETLFATVRQARRSSFDIVGFYHSHPDGSFVPSRKDASTAWVDRFYVIIPTTEHRVHEPTSWRIQVSGTAFEQETLLVI